MSNSTDQILAALAKRPSRSHDDRNINLLFAHCDTLQMELLLTNLRSARFAPRGQAVQDLQELQQAFEHRTWDILVFSWKNDYSGTMEPQETIGWLQQQGRDLPVLLLSPGQEMVDPAHWYSLGIDAVVPADNNAWLLLELDRVYRHLQTRRNLRSAETRLHQLSERNHYLIHHSASAFCFIQHDKLVFANTACAQLLGYDSSHQLNGHQLSSLVVFEQHDRLSEYLRAAWQNQPLPTATLTFSRPDGTRFEGLLRFTADEYLGESCLALEISEPRHEGNTLQNLDPITGLQNQHACLQALEAACARARRGGQDRSLLLLKLDHLDVIRTEVGDAGEAPILRAIAHILSNRVNSIHLLGRLEDDTFMVLMHNASTDRAQELGRTLCHDIRNHVCNVKGTAIHTTVSVGIVMINDSAPSSATLLEHALEAADSLHQGNRPGNGVKLYSPEQELLSQVDGKMNKRLTNALKLNRFKLLFQPIVPLRLESRDAYYEVLLRLISDSNKSISPNAFIIQSIEPEVLRQLDRWVIEHALESLQATRSAGPIGLFINLSGPSIRCSKLPLWLPAALEQRAIAPAQLVFQISESDAAVDLMAASRFTQTIQQLGCRTCLKHFGSSPNSTHVRQALETDFVKLDGSYMRDLQSDSLDLQTLEALLAPLQEQERVIIAPQVENTHVLPELYSSGVHLLQGHYLQPPREQMDYDFFTDQDS
ncbi:MAG: EAL domain-containing protein [Marinobacterium sp.]